MWQRRNFRFRKINYFLVNLLWYVNLVDADIV
jgi:hypothetical protein